MKKNFLTHGTIVLIAILLLSTTSCMKDLDLSPKYGLNTESVYNDPANYKRVLAKIYGGFSLTGNQGPAGNPDISGIDEGFSNYIRVLWNLQEVTTDEAVCGWLNDAGIRELNTMNWSSQHPWVRGMYYRIYFEITLCNEFIRQCDDAKLADRGFSETDKTAIKGFKNEARYLRALSYYHLMDLFGTGPFVTEADGIGAFFPQQKDRPFLFNYVESELLAVEPLLPAPKQNEYARVDQAAVWSLLSRMYLNAQTYINTSKFNECVNYSNKVINAGYALDADYKHLFLADNHLSNEVIFPIVSDGLFTQSYGVTTFLIHAAIGGSMPASQFGVNGGWSGLRSTRKLYDAFGADTLTDGRYLFYTAGQFLDFSANNQLGTFTRGYAVTKWKNITRSGAAGSDNTGNFVDTDFPMFRLAEMYLNYAEATLRGGNGDQATAIQYINRLRDRAFGAGIGNVASIDLPFILNERARELYWEGHRRTDLIRYGLFTGGAYVWPFKGGDYAGGAVSNHLNVYPIPVSDLTANPNLTQNPGY